MTVPAGSCLQCVTSREAISREHLICGIVSGYYEPELTDEWPRHRFRDWSDADLVRFGVRSEAYERHRRTAALDFAWIACEDRVSGHAIADADLPEWDVMRGECLRWCHTPGRRAWAKSVEAILFEHEQLGLSFEMQGDARPRLVA